jgi:hypothetical protein
MTQVHTRLSDHQVKELIERYIHHEADRSYIQEMLAIHVYPFNEELVELMFWRQL